MPALLAMVGLALASWVMRALFIVMVPAERLPESLREALKHLAPAVLAALVAVEVAGGAQGLDVARTALLLGSVLLAGIAAKVTGSLGLAVSIGLAAALLLDVVLV
jgi:branched-subunit amino acid transport protein